MPGKKIGTVVFLDIDGVLNNSKTENLTPNGFVGVDDVNLRRLKRLVDETGAVIVLSSDWRYEWDKNPTKSKIDGKYLTDRLLEFGLKIADKTPDVRHDLRGTEIKAWLNAHGGGQSFVILDDILFRDFNDGMLDRYLVKTDDNEGLTDEDVDKAIEIIRRQKIIVK